MKIEVVIKKEFKISMRDRAMNEVVHYYWPDQMMHVAIMHFFVSTCWDVNLSIWY